MGFHITMVEERWVGVYIVMKKDDGWVSTLSCRKMMGGCLPWWKKDDGWVSTLPWWKKDDGWVSTLS